MGKNELTSWAKVYHEVKTKQRTSLGLPEFRSTLKEVCEEVWCQFKINFFKTSTGTRGSFQENCFKTSTDTGGSFQDNSSKLPLRNFDFGLLILTLAANFARSGKPKFYYEVKILTLQVDIRRQS